MRAVGELQRCRRAAGLQVGCRAAGGGCDRRLRACHKAVRQRRDGEPHLVRVGVRVRVRLRGRVRVRAVVSRTSDAKAALGTVTDPTPTISNTELVAPPG